MNRKDVTSLPFESSDPSETQMWDALADLPRGEPSSHMRQRFYNGLHEAESRRWTSRTMQQPGTRGQGSTVQSLAPMGRGCRR